MAADSSDAQNDTLILSRPYIHVEGFQWIANLPDGYGGLSDTLAFNHVSQLRMKEDGVALSPHALHQVIREKGRGSFSHWNGALYFSSTDGSDPNSNGRTYQTHLIPSLPRAMAFGSCHIHDAMVITGDRDELLPLFRIYSQTHNTEEITQLIRYFRGELSVEAPLLDYLLSNHVHHPLYKTGIMETSAIIFAEICSPFLLKFGDIVLNRGLVWENVKKALPNAAPQEATVAVDQWYFQGLLQQHGGLHLQETRDRALSFMPDDSEAQLAARDVIAGATVVEQARDEIAEGIASIRALFDAPLVIHSHSLRYMPDGRAISWPAKFYRQLNDICREQDLPIINPSKLVEVYGPEFSLMPNLAYYTPQFKEKLADEMVRAAQQLLT